MNLKAHVLRLVPPPLLPYWRRVEASPIGYRLAKGAFWSLAGSLISRGLAMVASVLVARALGAEAYGEFGIIRSTVGMFGTLAGFGLGTTATKYIAELRDADPDRAGRVLALSRMVALITGGLMAAALALLAPWLAANTLAAPHLAGMIRVSGILLLFSAINGAEAGALAGFEAFRAIALRSLWAGLANFPLMVGGVYLFGLAGAVWALVLSMALNWLLNYLAVRKAAAVARVPLGLHGWRAELPVLWQFSLPAALSSAMVGPVTWACNAMLVNQPNGYVEMGIHDAVGQWYSLLRFLPALLGHVLLPILSERHGQRDTRQTVRAMTMAMKLNGLVVLPLVFAASIGSPYIMSLYGDEFADSWPTLLVVLFTSGLLAVQLPVGQVIVASGRMWTGFLMNLGWSIVFVLGTMALLDDGAFGLAVARGLAYIVHAVWTFGFARSLICSMDDHPGATRAVCT